MSRPFHFCTVGTLEKTSRPVIMIAQYFSGGSEMEGALVIGLILNIISMIACPIIGGNKGRSVVGWFFGGLFLSVIGLIIVSCLKEIPNGRN